MVGSLRDKQNCGCTKCYPMRQLKFMVTQSLNLEVNLSMTEFMKDIDNFEQRMRNLKDLKTYNFDIFEKNIQKNVQVNRYILNNRLKAEKINKESFQSRLESCSKGKTEQTDSVK